MMLRHFFSSLFLLCAIGTPSLGAAQTLNCLPLYKPAIEPQVMQPSIIVLYTQLRKELNKNKILQQQNHQLAKACSQLKQKKSAMKKKIKKLEKLEKLEKDHGPLLTYALSLVKAELAKQGNIIGCKDHEIHIKLLKKQHALEIALEKQKISKLQNQLGNAKMKIGWLRKLLAGFGSCFVCIPTALWWFGVDFESFRCWGSECTESMQPCLDTFWQKAQNFL